MKKIKDILSYSLFFLPDKMFCQLTFLLSNRRFPNLKNPILFNDKLLKLKLNSKNKIYNIIADKFQVRDYVEKRIGNDFLIPMIGIYNSVDEINFNELPNSFVLKITNGSQNNIVCVEKSKLNWNTLKLKINNWLNKNYYLRTREWQYKNIKSRIIIEEFIKDPSGDLIDYKFYCFNGVPKFVQIDSSRFIDHKRDFYNINFDKKLNFTMSYLNSKKDFHKPKNYNEMIKIVTTLSQDFNFIRVDLYNVNGRIYFGEMTLYPDNCNGKIIPYKYEEKLGNMLSFNL